MYLQKHQTHIQKAHFFQDQDFETINLSILIYLEPKTDFGIPKNEEWVGEVERELLTFPVGTHDDIVDTLAYACLNSATKRKWEAY